MRTIAERAVRAGLAVIDAVGRLATPEPLNVRLGVASGLVVVGDLIGEGAAQERGVVGRDCRTSPPGCRRWPHRARSSLPRARDGRSGRFSSSRISDRSRWLVLPSRSAPGASSAKAVWLSRFEALRSEATPLVGRDEDLDLLLRRWHQAKAGDGRVVLISGEPGIGKSRLGAALSAAYRRASRTRGCATSAHPTIRTARSTPLSRSSNAPPNLGATIRPKKGSASCRHCSAWSTAARTRSSCWPSCCHCRIRPPISTSARSASARCCSKRFCINSKPWRRASPF